MKKDTKYKCRGCGSPDPDVHSGTCPKNDYKCEQCGSPDDDVHAWSCPYTERENG